MPKKKLQDKTYQQWAAEKYKEELNEFYTESLADHPDLREYPEPNFPLNAIYTSSDKKSIHGIVEQISVAVGRSDYEGFKKLMGPFSLVPYQIMHNQKSQQLYWNWLQYHRALLFYRRAEFLFWGVQKKFFYDELIENILLKKINIIEEVKIKHPAPGSPKVERRPSQAAPRRIQQYKENILPVAFNSSHLQVDVFIDKLQTLDNGKLKIFLDNLTEHPNLTRFRTEDLRKRATDATRQPLAKIMQSQLYVSIQMANACMQADLDASPFLIDTYRRYLTQVEARLQKTFMHWLDIQFSSKVDVALIGRHISKTINDLLDKCCDLLETQAAAVEYLQDKEAELLLMFHDDHIKKSGIANLPLQDQRFNVVDKERKAVVPMLHFALRMYADALEERDALNAFKIVELLLARGASPFEALEVVPFEVEKTTKQSAFEYADLQPNWKIILSVLRQSIVRTPFAERLRIRLENYAEENARAPHAWGARLFQSKQKMEQRRLGFVIQLTSLLQTGDQYDDGRLIKAISHIIKNHTSHFVNSKLHRLLKNSLVDNEIVCKSATDEMEMEMQPLDVREDSDESQPSSPPTYALAMRSFFSRSPAYMQLSVDTESKEELPELEDGLQLDGEIEELDKDFHFDDERDYSPSF